MYTVGMKVMCVLLLEFYVGNHTSVSNVEIPCTIQEVGIMGQVSNVDYPLLVVNCKESFDTKFSFRLTDHPQNMIIRTAAGNDTCF